MVLLAVTRVATAVALSVLATIHSLPLTHAHTWIDCLGTSRAKLYDQSAEYIFGGAKGNGFCDGYGAGFPGRGVADIGQMYTHKMLKDQVERGAPICQRVDGNTYTGWRKRLKARAGVPIYYAYLPNGHIVKDKMARGTKSGVYWTGSTTKRLETTHDMTSDKLVDGKLTNYDDGNCGETLDANGTPGGRAGDGKPCIGSFTIPSGTAPGVYHFVWYWKFYLEDNDAYVDKERARGYFGASYSTCFEVEVEGGGGGSGESPVVAPAPTPAPPAKHTPTPVTKAPPATKAPAPPVTKAPRPTKTPAPAATKAQATKVPAPATTTAPVLKVAAGGATLDFSKYTPAQLAGAGASANGGSGKVIAASGADSDDEDDSKDKVPIKETWCV